MIVGVDEAGRGPLAGAVVVCALAFKKNPPFSIKDSKVLSWARRQEIFSLLSEYALFRVSLASAREIDEINILEATFLAFNRAIKGLLKVEPSLRSARFVIDGTLFRTDLDIDYVCMKRADSRIKEVSAASIVAKVTRDHLMDSLNFLYPQWGFSKHKGYPTKEHMEQVHRCDLTPFHRKSFYPCSKFSS
ncbi:MAG: ribonuclease HII [Candidatus Omnitrophica bacterium]|nr:ribonuclease HII [Candidatus Omnitrophota bacterium]MDD5430386.1 ribonuclease HII [Candidatus Omnitrophota bacterium]